MNIELASKNLLDFLQPDPVLCRLDDPEWKVRLQYEIAEVPKNLYYLPIPGDKSKYRHWKMQIQAEESWQDEGVWSAVKDREGYQVTPLPFYMTVNTQAKPDIGKFSEHIRRECTAALFAVWNPKSCNPVRQFRLEYRKNIKMEDVWTFLKLQHKNYESTTDFIRDYDYWEDRLYQTQKWFHYLMGDLPNKTTFPRWNFAVGDNLLDFIPIDEYESRIAAIKKVYPQSISQWK